MLCWFFFLEIMYFLIVTNMYTYIRIYWLHFHVKYKYFLILFFFILLGKARQCRSPYKREELGRISGKSKNQSKNLKKKTNGLKFFIEPLPLPSSYCQQPVADRTQAHAQPRSGKIKRMWTILFHDLRMRASQRAITVTGLKEAGST